MEGKTLPSKTLPPLAPAVLEEPEQDEEGKAEGAGAQVVEGTLGRGRQPEGHQLWDHLPGGRVVGEEATVPGGVDAAERGPEGASGTQ